MERRVARAKGERTLEEKKDLENEIEVANKEYNVVAEENKELVLSLKSLDDDVRQVKKQVREIHSKSIALFLMSFFLNVATLTTLAGVS